MIGAGKTGKLLAFGLCLAAVFAAGPVFAGLNDISLDGITAPSHMDGARVHRMLARTMRRSAGRWPT